MGREEKIMGIFGAIWGLTGVLLLLGSAVYRLAPLAIDAYSYDFFWYHWLSLFIVLFFMAYAEGYRGFQKGFSPRVASRALYLKNHPRFLLDAWKKPIQKNGANRTWRKRGWFLR